MRPSISLTSERTIRIAPASTGCADACRCGHGPLPRRLGPIIALRDTIAASSFQWVREIVPSASCLLVEFDPRSVHFAEAARVLDETLSSSAEQVGHQDGAAQRRITIPVCYNREFAPDLATVAQALGTDSDSVVERHCSASYIVECVGFAPGFAYIAGLDETLVLPRRSEPRPRVPRGSVAIAGGHTAVYPDRSPGGWHLIGRTPTRIFDAQRADPAMLRAGDAVTFRPIAPDEFEALRRHGAETSP